MWDWRVIIILNFKNQGFHVWYDFQEHIPKDKPSNPGRPYVIEDTTNSNVFITWQSSDKSTIKYELEVHYIVNFGNHSSFENKSWTLVYSDESNEWPIRWANVLAQISPLGGNKLKATDLFVFWPAVVPSCKGYEYSQKSKQQEFWIQCATCVVNLCIKLNCFFFF